MTQEEKIHELLHLSLRINRDTEATARFHYDGPGEVIYMRIYLSGYRPDRKPEFEMSVRLADRNGAERLNALLIKVQMYLAIIEDSKLDF